MAGGRAGRPKGVPPELSATKVTYNQVHLTFLHSIGIGGVLAIGKAVSIGLAALLSLTAFLGLAHGQEEAIPVLVMFNFGDGEVRWGQAVLADNRTALNATEMAAASLGLSVNVTWFPFGAFVTDIGGRDPIFPEFFQLLIWNESIPAWEPSAVGVSDLPLEGGNVIGWFLTLFESETSPMATPLHPFPTVAFRNNLANTGASGSQAPENPGLQWRFDTGGGEIGASPVGAEGTLYQVTLFSGTYAIDIQTGAPRWRAESVSGLSTPALHREGGGFEPPDLITGAKDGALYRLSGGNGDVVWRVVLQAETAFTGIASSPKVTQGRALVGVFNESGGPGGLVSVNVHDGSIQWRHETTSVHLSSPAVQKGSVYVGLMGLFNGSTLDWDPPYGLLSVFEENGTERWTFPTHGPVASSAAVADGTVYFTTRDGYLYAVSTDGVELFRRSIGPSTSSPAVGSGMVFAASGVLGTGGNVTAFDLQGNLRWRFTPNGPVQSSLTLASGHLLFSTNTEVGTVYALNATSGEVAWTYLPEPQQYILPTPAVLDGVVLIASDSGFVYALGPIEPPTAGFTVSPSEPTTGEEVTFDGSGSSDPDGTVDSWTWDFGDGATGSGEIVTHTYEAAGTFLVTLAVADDDGATATTSREVVVGEAPIEPTAPDVGILAATIVLLAAIVVAVAIFLYARRLRAS